MKKNETEAKPIELMPEAAGTLVAQTDSSPDGMIAHAMAHNYAPETLLKFIELKERWEATEARKAFNAAFAAFKAETVKIIKSTPVTEGPLKGTKYADLFDIVNGVTEALAKHNLSHSWRLTKDEKDWMEVTCILKHSAGHSETDAQGGAPDTGPGRNAIQARRSTRTYLEKSTLTGVTGLAAADMDDDGAGAGGAEKPANVGEKEIAEMERLIVASKADMAKFLKHLKVANLGDIPLASYKSVVELLQQKINLAAAPTKAAA